MADIYPFPLPRQQLPQPTDRLSDGFLHALPAPVGLWMPSKLAKAAADFTPLPQKHFGTLAGGITTTPGGFGTLGQSWATDGSSGNILLPSSVSLQLQVPFSFFALVKLSSAGSYPGMFSWAASLSFSSPVFFGCNATGHSFSVEIASVQMLNNFTITLGTWTFLAATIGASAQSFWIGTAGSALTKATTAKAIGAISYASGAPYIGSFGPSAGFWPGNIAALGLQSGLFFDGQVSLLYNCLLTGKPFPLFQPQASEMMMGTAVAPAGGRGGFLIGGGIGDFLCAA